MTDVAFSGLHLGTLRVRGGSEGVARDIASEFQSGLTSQISRWNSAGFASSLLSLQVVRQRGESVADAASRALSTHFAESRRGR